MGHQVKNISEKVDSLNQEESSNTMRSKKILTTSQLFGNVVMQTLSSLLNTTSQKQIKLRREFSFSDKLQQMKCETTNISDKLDTLIAQRETDDEGQL